MSKIEIEFRVRPVTRFIVTRFFHNPEPDEGLLPKGSQVIGEFVAPWHADAVCKAMAASEPGAICTLSDANVSFDVPDGH